MRAPSEHLPSEDIVDTTPTASKTQVKRTGRGWMAGLVRPRPTIMIAGIAGTALTGMATGALFTDVQTLATGSNMAPGDTAYGTIAVSNSGSLDEQI